MTAAQMLELAEELVRIQEDLPNEDDGYVLGKAAHYLEKYADALRSSNEAARAGEHGLSIQIEQRPEGGIHVWSPQLRGLILSGPDPSKVMADVWPAITVLLERGATLAAPRPVPDVREALEELQSAETTYRMIYDLDGYHHQNTLEALTALRSAGYRARAALAQPATNDGVRQRTIEECAKIVERYGLERINDTKDYPATIAAACIHRIRALAQPAGDAK